MDKNEGGITDPRTLHRFTYVSNNPIDLRDAMGLDYTSDSATGMVVQNAIGIQFRNLYVTQACVDQQISNILMGDCGASWTFGLGYPGGLRPDIANIGGGALYEIKPIKSAGDGLLQLLNYRNLLLLLNTNGVNWHIGTPADFTPSSPIVIDSTRVAYVAPPVLGVIVYFVADINDAFDAAKLLSGVQILKAIMSSSAASAAAQPSSVISISRGAGIANAVAESEAAELGDDVGVAVMEDAA